MSMTENAVLPRLDGYFWAGALTLAGLAFGASSLGLMPQVGGADAWTWTLLGAGILALGLSYYSLSSTAHANPTIWDWIFGALMFALGLGGFIGVDIALPIILIVLGIAALAGLLVGQG